MKIREAELYHAIRAVEVNCGCSCEFNVDFDTDENDEVRGVFLRFVLYGGDIDEWVRQKPGRHHWMYEHHRDESEDKVLERYYTWGSLMSINPYSVDAWIRNKAFAMEKEARGLK